MWGCTEKQAPSKSAMATNMPAELQGSSVAVGWCEMGCWGPLALRAQAHVVKLGLAEDCTDTLGIITVADAPYFADGILWYRCQLRGVVSANVVAWRGAGSDAPPPILLPLEAPASSSCSAMGGGAAELWQQSGSAVVGSSARGAMPAA